MRVTLEDVEKKLMNVACNFLAWVVSIYKSIIITM